MRHELFIAFGNYCTINKTYKLSIELRSRNSKLTTHQIIQNNIRIFFFNFFFLQYQETLNQLKIKP